ncbi:tyrosine-type recombinase/integrase [Actinomadura sp. NTSP31]|uniref:tyrosine-type recombinase/integrase n=1 Tax=Actinomadura sp. NTSP31 TaxID=1735447 RepID=UPI0035C0F801
MARVKDLWHAEVPDPDAPGRRVKVKTKRHPDRGGSKTAKRWLAIWIGPDGAEVTKAFHAKENAKSYARKQEEDAERGEYIDPKAGREQFGALAKKWIRLRGLGGSSRVRYESVFRLHVEPTFGHRQVKSPRPSEILEWLRELEKTHGPATQALAFHIVQGTFDLAVADGRRKDNPARSPIIPRVVAEPKERAPWTTDRVLAVVDQHPAPYRAVPLVAAGCGLRQAEAFALAVDDFDFDAGRLRIERQLVRVGNRIVLKLPKGGKARTAPLSPGVARTVQAHKDTHPPVAVTLPWMNEDGRIAEDPVTVELLFVWRDQLLAPPLPEGVRTRADRGRQSSADGKNLQMSTYNGLVWKVALARAGVIPPPSKNARGALAYEQAREDGMHALRHWFSTTLGDAGVSLAGIMDFMGHSRKAAGLPVTLGVYSHVTEETYEAARTAVDRSLFRLRPVQDQQSTGTEAEQAVSQ